MSVIERIGDAIGRFAKRMEQSGCRHHWRPARTRKSLVRYCPRCGKIEDLTPEMFYAYFGRIGP